MLTHIFNILKWNQFLFDKQADTCTGFIYNSLANFKQGKKKFTMKLINVNASYMRTRKSMLIIKSLQLYSLGGNMPSYELSK